MEDMLARAHSTADDAGLQILVAHEYWVPSLQDLNELIEQVADDDARYRHNQMQLQHSAWLLTQPPGYTDDDNVPDSMTQVTTMASMELPPMAHRTPTNTVMAQTRSAVAAEPMHMHTVIIMTMVAYATWNILSVIQEYIMKLFQ